LAGQQEIHPGTRIGSPFFLGCLRRPRSPWREGPPPESRP
jgi:hypothetical protein